MMHPVGSFLPRNSDPDFPVAGGRWRPDADAFQFLSGRWGLFGETESPNALRFVQGWLSGAAFRGRDAALAIRRAGVMGVGGVDSGHCEDSGNFNSLKAPSLRPAACVVCGIGTRYQSDPRVPRGTWKGELLLRDGKTMMWQERL